MAEISLGIDTGGTFTDCIAYDAASERLIVEKVPSAAGDSAAAVLSGIASLLAEFEANDPARLRFLVHGTTIPTNTIIELSGTTVGVITTTGMRDSLLLRRIALPDPSNLLGRRPLSLVKRRNIHEVDERVLADGTVATPLDDEGVLAAAKTLRDNGVSSIVVAFLHSYRNAEHEHRARDLIATECPELYVKCSSDIWPKFREYERAMVAVLDSYVGPRTSNYFRNVRDGVKQLVGMSSTASRGALLVPKSNGGLMSFETAIETPVHSLQSGPAAGVVAAHFLSTAAGFSHAVAWDMGGTSSDAAIITGQIPHTEETRIGEFPFYISTIDVSSIGAGGGSLASVDRGGIIHVGPASAGANPGPAAYGRGGQRPTLTDAYVTLGWIPTGPIAGGNLEIHKQAAERVMADFAAQAGLSGPIAAAEAVVNVATAEMYAQLVPLLAQSGADAGEFALVAYGGAGPTHGASLAKAIGFDKLLIPPLPGLLCAWGCLLADLIVDMPTTVHFELTAAAMTRLEAALEELERQGSDWMAAQGAQVEHVSFERIGNLRYQGQSFELQTPLPPLLTVDSTSDVRRRFETVHEQRYGYIDEGSEVEIVDIVVRTRGLRSKPTRLAGVLDVLQAKDLAGESRVEMTYYQGEWYGTPVRARGALTIGDRVVGPLVLTQTDTTTYVPPGFEGHVDEHFNLILEVPR